MPSVIVRKGYSVVDGFVVYDEEPMTYELAERIAGRRLDRRKNYAIINGTVCMSATWTGACSGCTNDLSGRGMGCHECGYHGRLRQSMWVPIDAATEQKLNQRTRR